MFYQQAPLFDEASKQIDNHVQVENFDLLPTLADDEEIISSYFSSVREADLETDSLIGIEIPRNRFESSSVAASC